MVESLIKRMQLIARPLIMKSLLSTYMWRHAILHTEALIRVSASAYEKYSLIQLAFGREPNISHLIIFGCDVYVSTAPSQRTKIGPQRRLGIYVGCDSPLIIQYLEPQTGDLLTARFADCHFDEKVFSVLEGENKQAGKNLNGVKYLLHLDLLTKQCRIMHLQSIANQLPDAFADTKSVKNHIYQLQMLPLV